MRRKAFIFDFDGVIVDSVDIKTEAFAKLFENEKKEIRDKVVAYHINNTGVSRYEKFAYIYDEILHRPLGRERFLKLCDRFAELVAERVTEAGYIKGAIPFLEKYHMRYIFFVVSATPQRELEEIIKKKKIQRFFKAIYGAPIKKSDAVKTILIEEHMEPDEVIYVGDSMADYKAANDNSVRFAAVIDKNKSMFSNIECIKIKDIDELDLILDNAVNGRDRQVYHNR